ncbi:uncharacterized oxidoreductase y4hM [Arthrobacter sp. Hiyo4]|nr:uncharacterized oxidoreductase y4hM [Arthrobacter sp. Hiyo4]
MPELSEQDSWVLSTPMQYAQQAVKSPQSQAGPWRQPSRPQPARARFAAATPEALIARDDVDVVHICTPNATHADLARKAIAAGKAVICEKPLATSVDDARELTALADQAGVVTGVPFVYRFYPAVREARDRISRGDAGNLWLLHGSYLQDWLAGAEATNWRVDSAIGGASRAFGDIGVHWCDLMEFTTGHRITRLVANTSRAYDQRETGGSKSAVATEDGATLLFETDKGATGSLVVSQVSPGRKNRLWFSFDGTEASFSFNQERPETLHVGRTDSISEIPVGPQTLTTRAAGGTPDFLRATRRDTRTASTPSSQTYTRLSRAKHLTACPLSGTDYGQPSLPMRSYPRRRCRHGSTFPKQTASSEHSSFPQQLKGRSYETRLLFHHLGRRRRPPARCDEREGPFLPDPRVDAGRRPGHRISRLPGC